MSTERKLDWERKPSQDQSPIVIGNSKNHWKWSKDNGFDLTHSSTPDSEPVHPRLKLQCATTSVVIDPAKTALMVIDLQNFHLHDALGNDNPEFHSVENTVLHYAIPAARESGVQIIWVTTGYADKDLEETNPGVFKTFNFRPLAMQNGKGRSDTVMYRPETGIGDEIGKITDKNGEVIDGGRMLVKGSWNSWLHGPSSDAYDEGKGAVPPDVHFHKSRTSGMCDSMKDATDFLREHNIRTLLFTGINIDSCVMGTLQDAGRGGFDTILLKDGCANDGPSYVQSSIEHDRNGGWGFLSGCKDFAAAAGVKVDKVKEMDKVEGVVPFMSSCCC